MASQELSAKLIPGTNFAVDCFRRPPPSAVHILTHAHSGAFPGAAARRARGARPRALPFWGEMAPPGDRALQTAYALAPCAPALEQCSVVPAPQPPPPDHYTGLSEAWEGGPIYCTPVTAALAAHLTGVAERWLRPLPLGETHTIDGCCRALGTQGSPAVMPLFSASFLLRTLCRCLRTRAPLLPAQCRALPRRDHLPATRPPPAAQACA
jgi:hypothetical protein